MPGSWSEFINGPAFGRTRWTAPWNDGKMNGRKTGEEKMPKAYWVVTYRSVKNPEAWQAYAKLAGPAITASGGRFLVRNKPAKTYEAGMNERVVMIEFDSVDAAIAAHDTPAYQEALKTLGTDSVVRDMRVVEGVE
jgi:uncharacterized protein (DUF1330 family)